MLETPSAARQRQQTLSASARPPNTLPSRRRMRRRFRQAEKMCVCSTLACEIIGTRTRSNFPWSDDYPKLCDDCARAWDIIMKARRHASNDVESSRKFIKKHPMKDVEEFIDFTMKRRLDEDKPDPKAKSKAKSKANPEPKPKPDGPTPKSKADPIPQPGAARRSDIERQPVECFAESISQLETRNL